MVRYAVLGLALVAVGAGPRDQQVKSATLNVINNRAAELQRDPGALGCLGRDAVTCLATLTLAIPSGIAPRSARGFHLPGAPEKDINGNPVAQFVDFLVPFDPRVPGEFAPATVKAELYLADGEHVDSIDFSLKAAPLLARTQQDWDATKVFELATAVLGPKCVGTDRLAFYRRYDAAQRQRSEPESIVGTLTDPSVASGAVGTIDMCGVSMVATSVAGISTSGTFGGSSLTFRTR